MVAASWSVASADRGVSVSTFSGGRPIYVVGQASQTVTIITIYGTTDTARLSYGLATTTASFCNSAGTSCLEIRQSSLPINSGFGPQTIQNYVWNKVNQDSTHGSYAVVVSTRDYQVTSGGAPYIPAPGVYEQINPSGGVTYVFFSSANATGTTKYNLNEDALSIYGGNEARLYDADSSNYVAIKSSDTVGSDLTFVMPPSYGSAGRPILGDGAGNLYFGTSSLSDVTQSSVSVSFVGISSGAILTATQTFSGPNTFTSPTVISSSITMSSNVNFNNASIIGTATDRSTMTHSGTHSFSSTTVSGVANFYSTIRLASGSSYFLGDPNNGFRFNNSTDSINILIANNTGEVTQPHQPSFLATKTGQSANQTGDGTNNIVAFDGEVYDQGTDFVTSTFTAPITGKYLFSGCVGTSGWDGTQTSAQVKIVTSNRTYRAVTTTPPGSGKAQDFVISVIADMDAGDTATLQFTGSGGNRTVDIEGDAERTFFSCSLIN